MRCRRQLKTARIVKNFLYLTNMKYWNSFSNSAGTQHTKQHIWPSVGKSCILYNYSLMYLSIGRGVRKAQMKLAVIPALFKQRYHLWITFEGKWSNKTPDRAR